MDYYFEEGRLDKDGILLIKRKNKYKTQYCIYASDAVCCDCCPAFIEPLYNPFENEMEVGLYVNGAIIKFCKGRLIFKKFVDERE